MVLGVSTVANERPALIEAAKNADHAAVRALLEPPVLSADEAEGYAKESRRRIIERFRMGVPIGSVVMCAIFLLWSEHLKDSATRSLVLVAAVIGMGALVLYVPLCRLRIFRERPNWLILPISLVVTGAGAAASIASGAIDAELDLVAAASLLVVWIYGSVLAPLPPRDFLLDILAQYAVVTVGLWLGSPSGLITWMYVALTCGGGGLAMLGVVIRENADRRSFVAHRRLDDAHRLVAEQRSELERMNAQLEGRVEAQVKEIRGHMREVDALNTQLQQRVRERSRELAAALEKPHNIMLTSIAPGVKLLDFGISKTADGIWSSAVTATGQILGSPAYMAPEQFKNSSSVTSACDVYSLGLVLYEVLVGRGPFVFHDLLAAMAAHTLEDPPLADCQQIAALALGDVGDAAAYQPAAG